MGSIDAACISGFLCRLCSEMHRTVIHIYGDQGLKKGLAQKINEYLPVTITPTDPLPKTICETCMTRVEQHHELMVKMARNRAHFAQLRGQVRATLERTLVPQSTSATELIDNFIDDQLGTEENGTLTLNLSTDSTGSSSSNSNNVINNTTSITTSASRTTINFDPMETTANTNL